MRTFIQSAKTFFNRSAGNNSVGKAMKIFLMLVAIQLSMHPILAQGGNLIEISGQVIDAELKTPLQSVSVSIKGAVSGTITDNNGSFTLRTKTKFPLTLVFSSIGFKPQEFEVKGPESKLNIALVTQTQLGNEVVVTASRVSENI